MSWTARDGQRWSAAIGSTRLAVLDLSPAGRQPMSTPDGRYSIVYNGEITNYIELRDELMRAGFRFTSVGDTEVLLNAWAAWGPDSLHRLEGMYAFAVLDRAAQSLTLSRDVFGIKPLFYRLVPGEGIAFASEVASILPLIQSPPRLDWFTAVSYLSAGAYDDSTATFIEGIRQLAPGRSISVDLSAGQILTDVSAPWRPAIETDESITASQAVDGVRTLLLESVHRNLRADVPVGIALSGGIDSSIIACAVRLLEPDYPMRVFSFISPEATTDESRWIDLINDQVRAQAWTVTPTAGDLAADLDDLLIAQGEPFGSTSIYAQYRVFRLMQEAGVVVSLDGQGGDEVFAGYHGYVGQRTRSLIETGDVFSAARFVKNWSRWPGRSLRNGLSRAGVEFAPAWAVSAAFRRGPGVVPAGVDLDALRARGLGWDWPVRHASRDGLRGVRVKAELRALLTERGLQALLRHGDRNSMRFSIESRVPFLDRSLVDFVLALPERMLVDEKGTTKAVLRAALRGVAPDAVLDRRDKIGFETPETSWIDAQRSSFAELVAIAPEIGFLDKEAIMSGIDPARPSRRGAVRPMEPRLTWRVFNLYRWASLLGIDAS